MALSSSSSSSSFSSSTSKQGRLIELLSARRKISDFLRANGEELTNISHSRMLPPAWVVEFARYTTLTLKAPPGWIPGAPLVGSHPPAPQPEEMRDGALQRFNQRCNAVASSSSAADRTRGDAMDTNQYTVPSSTKSLITSTGLKRKPVQAPIIPSAVLTMDVIEEMEVTGGETMEPVPEQPQKKARQVNLSFGLSDSESEGED